MRSGFLYLYYLIVISVLFSCAPKDDRDLDWTYTGDTSCATSNRPFGGGNGTPENPYTICTRDHLINVGRQSGGIHYKQTRDIDLGGSSQQHPQDLIFAVNSTYNGSGFQISGLYIYDITAFFFLAIYHKGNCGFYAFVIYCLVVFVTRIRTTPCILGRYHPILNFICR